VRESLFNRIDSFDAVGHRRGDALRDPVKGTYLGCSVAATIAGPSVSDARHTNAHNTVHKGELHERVSIRPLQLNNPGLLYSRVRIYLQQFGSGGDVIVKAVLSSE
jgi:hypothetical protein